MADKTLKTRIQHKRGSSNDWSQATNFTPLDGELIVYNEKNGTPPKFKVGDGTTLVGSLPFATVENDSHNHTTSTITDFENSVNEIIENSGAVIVDDNGKISTSALPTIPQSLLPSYVDDVLEYSSKSAFPANGEVGKIYVSTDTNLTYRWSGSTYTEISPSLALGETSSTAYAGNKGAAAYKHAVTNKGIAKASGLYKITTNSEGHVTAASAVTKNDITGLGIPAQDTTYNAATSTTAGLMSAADKAKLDTLQPGGGGADITLDTTLSVAGAAADAKATGDEINKKLDVNGTAVAAQTLTQANLGKALYLGSGDYADITDLNDLTLTGLFQVAGDFTNAPLTNPCYILSVTSASNNRITQFGWRSNQTAASKNIYMRRQSDTAGTWDEWTIVAGSGLVKDCLTTDAPVTIEQGGTGATTAADALTNLGITATAAELNKLDGVTATTAELNYVDGVTSNIQTQLNDKAPTSHASTTTTYGVASTSNYGHVKIGDNLNISSGVISLTKKNVTDALGYTPPTSDTNTDTKVQQSETNASNFRPIILGTTNSSDTTALGTTVIGETYVNTSIYAKPNVGALYATNFHGGGSSLTDLNASNISSGTLSIENGGTGATTAASACTNLGALQLTGGTLTGNLTINANLTVDNIKGNLNCLTAESSYYTYFKTSNSETNTGFIRYNGAASYRRFQFAQYSSGSGGYSDNYLLPRTSTSLTENGTYDILTSKNTVTVSQGGTGATTAADARTNLGITLANLGDVIISTTTPTTVTNGKWYLIKQG